MTKLKTALSGLILLFMAANFTTFGMEQQKKEYKISRSLMIDHTETPVIYATKRTHALNNLQFNQGSTINDPLTRCILTDISNNTRKNILLPTKKLQNLSTGSKVQIPYISTTNRSFLINATCQVNPDLEGANFYDQNKKITDSFYRSSTPSIHVEEKLLPFETKRNNTKIEKDSVEELIAAGVVREQIIPIRIPIRNNAGHVRISIMEETTYPHGQYGITTNKALEQSIIHGEGKIPKNTSYIKALRKREQTGSFRQ